LYGATDHTIYGMTVYRGKQAISREWKIWPWVTIVLVVIGICGACWGLVAAFGLLKSGDELVSSTVPVDSSASVGQVGVAGRGADVGKRVGQDGLI